MDLQLHDGNYAIPQRRFTTGRQLLNAAYGTPTYFKFIDQYGLSGYEDDSTLEAGFMDFINQAKQARTTIQSGAPQPEFGKQQIIDVGKAAAGAAFQAGSGGASTAESVYRGVQAGIGLVPVVGPAISVGMGVVEGILGGKSGPMSPQQTLNYYNKFKNYPKSHPGGAAALMIAKKYPEVTQGLLPGSTQQQPIVAATPTGFPVVGKTAASLAPVIPPAPEPKGTTFAGIDTKTLLLLGLGGFLAFKLLNK